MRMSYIHVCALACLVLLGAEKARADENLFGYVKGAETIPEGSWEFYQIVTNRSDKSVGHYSAWDTRTELEYGYTDRLSLSAGLLGQAINTSGLVIDGYLPGDKDSSWRVSGFELNAKYNFLSPALDNLGLSTNWELVYTGIDPHSGQDKDTWSFDTLLILQKYFLEGQLVWVSNFGIEATWAKRGEIANLPPDFEWPTDPEMEIELLASTALTYRFVSNWFFGAELAYETEFETEVGQERYSWFGGPTLHYGGPRWWVPPNRRFNTPDAGRAGLCSFRVFE